jgi:hypothetical protein
MSLTRIQVLLDEKERTQIKREALSEGSSVSAWIRRAALDRMKATRKSRRLETRKELESFFSGCDLREQGREPDMQEHREVIDSSRRPR